jgi:hypothetical protein
MAVTLPSIMLIPLYPPRRLLALRSNMETCEELLSSTNAPELERDNGGYKNDYSKVVRSRWCNKNT